MDATVVSRSYTVTRASPWDLLAIQRLERAAFPRDAYDVIALFEVLVTSRHRTLKAVMSEHIVGFVAGELDRQENTGWIVTLVVHPDVQGQGIGAGLLNAAERWLNQPRMKLTVRRSNARAIALYERMGYQYKHAIYRYYNDGEDGLLMEKELS